MHVTALLIATLTTATSSIWSVAALDESIQFQAQAPGQKPVINSPPAPAAAAANQYNYVASGGNGQGAGRKSSPFTDAYKKRVEDLLEEWHVPGVAIGVVDGDHVWTEVRVDTWMRWEEKNWWLLLYNPVLFMRCGLLLSSGRLKAKSTSPSGFAIRVLSLPPSFTFGSPLEEPPPPIPVAYSYELQT